jgi:hypothetical protein
MKRARGITRGALFATVFLILLTALGRAHADRVGVPFVVRHVRVFDGGKAIPETDVVVADGKIVAIGPGVVAPTGAEVIDGEGDTLLPGLFDSHVHMWSEDVLTSALAFGVTTELDMFSRWRIDKVWRERENKGDYTIADFRTASTAATVPHGHGTDDVGVDIPTITRPEEAQAWVDARDKEGSDYIKIFYDNGPRWPSMSEATMAAIVQAAHKRGKLVVVHGSWRDVVEAGADGLAHIPPIEPPPPDFGKILKAHHMFAITTLTYNDQVFGPGRLASKLPRNPLVAPYLGPLMVDSLERPPFHSPEHLSSEYAEAALRLLRDAGVPVLAGTDSAGDSPTGALLHNELQLMVRAGLSPLEALADATSVPAKTFALSDRGVIVPGKRADLLLVRGDPTVDIQATLDIVAIWKQGVKFDRDAYRRSSEQRNETWRFGPGWWLWTDTLYGGKSTVTVKVVDGGPDHSRTTMFLSGDVRPGISQPFSGAKFYPARRGFSPVDFSGVKDFTFWSRGDGKQYWISAFTQTQGLNHPLPVGFVARDRWEKHTIRFSAFGTDGHDLAAMFIGSAQLGTFALRVSGFRIGSGARLGVEAGERQVAAMAGEPPTRQLFVASVLPGSPADLAEIKTDDIIVKCNGVPVNQRQEVVNLLLQAKIGTSVPLEIVRDGKHQTVQVPLLDSP